jgi:methylenetetrahydrofolate reductase (NADPH)
MPVTLLHQPLSNERNETASLVSAFLRHFSMEITRPSDADLAELKSALPAKAPVYVPAIPKSPLSELIAAATRLRAQGFEPVPHIAARSIESHAALEDLLSRLSRWANVRRALVIGGDVATAAGPFNSALELIDSGLLQRHGIAEIGIAGYPEGHPRLSTESLDRELAAKIEAAEQTGLAVTIVTQFCFDAVAIANWIERLRALCLEHPVQIGMAGPANVAALMRYARLCGVRASAHALACQPGLVKHLLGVSTPDRIIRPLAEACGERPLGRVSAHFFSFGGAAATARWACAAAAGRIVLDRAGGFGVAPR